jgi:Na+-transporting NADH:ubiquinone oxidoreductase subunit NqrC
MASNLKSLLFRFLMTLSLIASVWSSAAYAQKLHSFTHEELEDHRQENIVKNMHFADDVLKTKFLEAYVPYQERLFHVDHAIRDLTNQYVQADQQTLSDKEAAKFLARGLKFQNERNEILHNYIETLKKAVPSSVALRAWEVENKLRAEASALYLQNVPFVTQ